MNSYIFVVGPQWVYGTEHTELQCATQFMLGGNSRLRQQQYIGPTIIECNRNYSYICKLKLQAQWCVPQLVLPGGLAYSGVSCWLSEHSTNMPCFDLCLLRHT